MSGIPLTAQEVNCCHVKPFGLAQLPQANEKLGPGHLLSLFLRRGGFSTSLLYKVTLAGNGRFARLEFTCLSVDSMPMQQLN